MSTEKYSLPAGELSAHGMRLAIVVSRFNEAITERLLDGAMEAIKGAGGELHDGDVVRIPGAFEFPLAVRAVVAKGKAAWKEYDGVICLGAVVRGDTPHFDFVAGEAARGIANASVEMGVPVSFGVLTANTMEQAMDRAGGKLGNKGYDAAMTTIEMVHVLHKLRPVS